MGLVRDAPKSGFLPARHTCMNLPGLVFHSSPAAPLIVVNGTRGVLHCSLVYPLARSPRGHRATPQTYSSASGGFPMAVAGVFGRSGAAARVVFPFSVAAAGAGMLAAAGAAGSGAASRSRTSTRRGFSVHACSSLATSMSPVQGQTFSGAHTLKQECKSWISIAHEGLGTSSALEQLHCLRLY